MKYIYLCLICLFYAFPISARHEPNYDSLRLASIEQKLNKVVEVDATYLDEVDISVGKLPLSDMLRNVAKIAAVNLTVRGSENAMVTCNFSRAKITDLIFFLCREYDLDIDVVGNIVAIRPAAPIPSQPKVPEISYDERNKTLGYNLNGDILIDVVKKITDLVNVNIIVPKSMYQNQISGFVKKMPLDEAISTLASINGLEADKAPGGVWEFTSAIPAPSDGRPVGSGTGAFTRKTQYGPNQILVDSMGLITVQIGRGSIQDIVTELCTQQQLNYFFLSPINQQTSVFVREVSFQLS